MDLNRRHNMERTVTTATTYVRSASPPSGTSASGMTPHFDDRDRDQNEIIVDGLLDTITK